MQPIEKRRFQKRMETTANQSAAGLIYGDAPHYIDHLAPLCSFLNIPLLVTEEEIEESLKRFYPAVKTILIKAIQMPDFLVSRLDIIFTCTPRILFDEIFFFTQKLYNKRIHTIWCPHGNSDKGHRSPFMEGLNKEEIALVYGQKMIDFLKLKGAFSQLKRSIIIGNYRNFYYLKHKEFYDQLIKEKITKKLPLGEKTILYAPTWEDSENSSSFRSALPYLIKHLPTHWNLIVKPHPHLIAENEEKNRNLIDSYETHERVLFLLNFPPIIPLLERVDLYIGDFSSIGYDFLRFNKPMFFLNEHKRSIENDLGLYLYQCGIEILPEDYERLYEIIKDELKQDSLKFEDIRKKIDAYTFDPTISENNLKKAIFASFACFPDPDLNFF